MTIEGLEIREDVLNADDAIAMAPRLAGHRKLVERVLHFLSIDKVNAIHGHNCTTPGVAFTTGLLGDLGITLDVSGREVLDSIGDGAFITVSNHPFGALDGISLINLVGGYRSDFKVMVNMILNRISAMRPNFIAVDALASDDPAKKAVSMRGIKEAIVHVRRGHPIGFFPAGAVSKVKLNCRLEDREWQPSIIRLIAQLKVPVVPIFFHGSNSWWFNFLGIVSWKLRTLRLPAEVFRRKGDTLRISIGNPISPEEVASRSGDIEELGRWLKMKTYELRK